jgi:pectate lyase
MGRMCCIVLQYSYNNTRRSLGGCGKGNPVDDCWRCNGNWEQNRQALADCAIGFGKNAIGGKNGEIYVVTDESDDDVVNPKMGTLRYAVVQSEPLWITFSRNMNIKLKEELIMNSFKTIDGRGHNVHISGGACLTLQFVNNIIIHGVHIHDCKSTGPADVRSSPSHYGRRGKTDGDAVNIFGSHDIWVDHCYFAQCTDGLVDVIKGSTDITISNNYFENHDKVGIITSGSSSTYTTFLNFHFRVTRLSSLIYSAIANLTGASFFLFFKFFFLCR